MKKSINLSIALTLILSGCASLNNPKDPLEGFNRAMFTVNENVDSAVLKPIATGYDYIAPMPIKTGVSNFFENLSDVPSMANNLLQGNIKNTFSDFGRLLINTTIGIAGLFDVASEMGIEKSDQDFGQTLAKWGVGQGPYLYLPLIGPSSIRDISGKTVDLSLFDPVGYIKNIPVRNTTYGLKINDTRYKFLATDNTLDAAAIDKYDYVRDAYTKMRYYKIYNKPMPIDEPDEPENISNTVDTKSVETNNIETETIPDTNK